MSVKMYPLKLSVSLLQNGDTWSVMVGTEGEMLGPLVVNTEAMDDGTRAPKWADVVRAVRIWGAEMIESHSGDNCVGTCPLCTGLMPKEMVE